VSLDLPVPLVYLITTGECDAKNYREASDRILQTVKAAVEWGVDLIQLREKSLPGKLLFDLAERVAEITSGSRTRLLVNDRLDIALASGADGVHLTSTSVAAKVIREQVGDSVLIGVSCHSLDEVADARAAPADFALYGPVFASPGKVEGVGLDPLRNVCVAAEAFPVLAIGGIDETNYQDVLDTGAAGFAAIRALNDIDSMRHIMKELGR
jgi:thiamine-phosphate pyrophosphorylase